MSGNHPQTPEIHKMIALQKSLNRFFKFSDWLREEAGRQGCSVDNLLEEKLQDTVYRYLELDPEKLKQENKALIEYLQGQTGKKNHPQGSTP